MPTPSSSAPDPLPPRSPRLFAFSSCPDPDEVHHQSSITYSQPRSPPSVTQPPSVWRRTLLSGHSSAIRTHTEDGPPLSQPTTMSPGPQSDASRDVNMEQEPPAVVLIAGGGTEEDGPKQTSLDEDILNNETMQIDGTRDTDGESSAARTAATATTPATAGISDRGKRRAGLATPTAVDSDDVEMWGLMSNAQRWVEDSGLAGMGYEYSQMRVIPTSSSSFLRPGSRFTGTQQSERQRYDVQVEIKHVDLRESFLCGYLKIQGLSDPLSSGLHWVKC